MKWRNEYLSDEELSMLISDVEQADMVTAPPDMKEHILFSISENASNRKKEFRGYCFRVWTSVAAAVLMIFLLPEVLNGMQMKDDTTMLKENDTYIWKEIQIPEWLEADKEKNSNEQGVFTDFLGTSILFDNEDKLKLFNDRNGG